MILSMLLLTPALPLSGSDKGVGAEGRLRPAGGVVTVSLPMGQSGPERILEVFAAEGTTVPAGEVLATLSGESMRNGTIAVEEARLQMAREALRRLSLEQTEALRQAEAKVTRLEAQLLAAQAEAEAQAITASIPELEPALAQAALLEASLARERLAQIKEQLPLLEAEWEARIKSAETTARVASGRQKEALMAEVEVAKASRDRALAEARSALTTAERELTIAEERARGLQAQSQRGRISAEAVASAQARVAVLEASLASAQAARKELPAWQEIGRAESAASVESAQAALAVAQAHHHAMLVEAPQKGTILKVFARAGETPADGRLLLMADLAEMVVETEVYISDLPRVRQGAEALVYGDGFEEGLPARVERIGSQVAPNFLRENNPTAYSDLRVVAVRLLFTDQTSVPRIVDQQVTVRILP